MLYDRFPSEDRAFGIFVSVFTLHDDFHCAWVDTEFLVLQSVCNILFGMTPCENFSNACLGTNGNSRGNCTRLMPEEKISSVFAVEEVENCRKERKNEKGRCKKMNSDRTIYRIISIESQ